MGHLNLCAPIQPHRLFWSQTLKPLKPLPEQAGRDRPSSAQCSVFKNPVHWLLVCCKLARRPGSCVTISW